MCCPYFDPVEPHPAIASTQSAMLPLGDAWSGVCRSGAAPPVAVDDAAVEQWCNRGYARGVCARFPMDEGPDAVRFAIGGTGAEVPFIRYSIERDHHPFAHGDLQPAATPQTLLDRQARAYFASYRKRIGEAAVR